jgi:hypothetical protein
VTAYVSYKNLTEWEKTTDRYRSNNNRLSFKVTCGAQQAKLHNIYKNTKLKLLKTNAGIWFNKMCRDRQLKPNYINITINGHKQKDKRTMINAVKFRINQELTFVYKKQHLNQRLYQAHLECALQYNGMWQCLQDYIDQQLHRMTEVSYQTLNKKLDVLTHHQPKHNKTQNTPKFQSRVINLTNISFKKEQLHTLSLGPSYTTEQEPKCYINELIFDTEHAIRNLEP